MLDLLANGHEHIFIDEWEPGLFEEFKNELVKANDFNDQFLWIAFHRRVSMQLDTALVDELQSIFRIVQLEYSMRNSKAIIKYCIENPDLFQEMMLDTTIGEAPYNLPTGLKPKSSAPEEAFHHIVEMTKTESVLIVYLLNHDDEPGDDEDVDEENNEKNYKNEANWSNISATEEAKTINRDWSIFFGGIPTIDRFLTRHQYYRCKRLFFIYKR